MTFQLAVAAGAIVIATTSSPEKVEVLKGLGAKHVLNYSQDKNWGETAKSLTRDGTGVDIIVEVSSVLGPSLYLVTIPGSHALETILGRGSVVSAPKPQGCPHGRDHLPCWPSRLV